MLVPARAFQIDASLETHFDSLLTSGRKDTGILIGAVGSHDRAAASAKLANLRVCGVANSIHLVSIVELLYLNAKSHLNSISRD